MYIVIVCYKCRRFLLVKIDQRTKRCPHCGTLLTLKKVKRVAYAKSSRAATDLIRALKEKPLK